LHLFLVEMTRTNESSSDQYDTAPKEDEEMTETVTSPYRVTAGEGLADVWWKSGRVTVKAAGAEVGDAFSQIEVDDPRGSGPPLHLHHNEDETFYVLEGDVTFLVGDERIDVAAGGFLFAPRDIPHAYVVRSERARMLVTASTGGVEQVFVSLGAPVTGSEPPTDVVMPPMDELMRVFTGYGCEILGPPLSLGELS
jgi:quercetin dioxygenase-like cupin family protein